MYVLLLSLLACPGGGGKDSGGTGSGACGGAPSVVGINTVGDCTIGGTCTWQVDATDEMGTVKMTIVETGDPTSTCGPGKTLNECGVWEETHTAFTNAGSGSAGGACAEAKSITLDVVDDFKNQVNNTSTLFDDPKLGQVTILVTTTDASGADAGCAVAGDDVSFFASECSNQL